MENKKRYRNIIFAVVFIIIGIWIGGWILTDPKDITNQPVSDIFGSMSALFGGLAFGGVIISIFMQLAEMDETQDELRKTAESNRLSADSSRLTAEANRLTAIEAKEKAILDLYQTFSTERFQIIKASSFKIMISAIQSKDYADFMISRFFVISECKLTKKIAKQLPIYERELKNGFNHFKKEEQFDRFRLDELINFFILLSNKDSSKDIIKSCEFFYDWFRPLFLFMAELQLEYYNNSNNPDVQTYSTKPYLVIGIKKLDEIYGHDPLVESSDIWGYILNHPKVKSYGIDPKYEEYR